MTDDPTRALKDLETMTKAWQECRAALAARSEPRAEGLDPHVAHWHVAEWCPSCYERGEQEASARALAATPPAPALDECQWELSALRETLRGELDYWQGPDSIARLRAALAPEQPE